MAATAETASAAHRAFAADPPDVPDPGPPGVVGDHLVLTRPDPERCSQVRCDVIDFCSADGSLHQQDNADHIWREPLDVPQFYVAATDLAQPMLSLL